MAWHRHHRYTPLSSSSSPPTSITVVIIGDTCDLDVGVVDDDVYDENAGESPPPSPCITGRGGGGGWTG